MNENNNGSPTDSKRKSTPKRIAAVIGICLLVLLYIAALLAAIFDSTSSGSLFKACLFATIAVPLLIWIYTWLYRKMTGRD
jgi:cytochrome bd-type quinol oxidase subunit 2